MSVAKRYVACGDAMSANIRLAHRNVSVSQRRPANSCEMIDRYGKTVSHGIIVCEIFERLALALFGSLPVRDVQKSQLVVLFVRDRRGNARVHSTRNQTDCQAATRLCFRTSFDAECFVV